MVKAKLAMVSMLSVAISGCSAVGIVGDYKNRSALEPYCDLPGVGSNDPAPVSAKSLYLSYEAGLDKTCFDDDYGALLESAAFEAIEARIQNSKSRHKCRGPALDDGFYRFSVHEMGSNECSSNMYVELGAEKCISAEKIDAKTSEVGYEYESSLHGYTNGYAVYKISERVFDEMSHADIAWITTYSVSKSSSWCPASGQCFLSCEKLTPNKFGSYKGGWKEVVRPVSPLETIKSLCLKNKRYLSRCNFNLGFSPHNP